MRVAVPVKCGTTTLFTQTERLKNLRAGVAPEWSRCHLRTPLNHGSQRFNGVVGDTLCRRRCVGQQQLLEGRQCRPMQGVRD